MPTPSSKPQKSSWARNRRRQEPTPKTRFNNNRRVGKMLHYMGKSLSVAALFFALACAQASAWGAEILVSAAASLTDVLNEISKGYQAKSMNTVKFNFGPSSGLARQIEEGAPADMF